MDRVKLTKAVRSLRSHVGCQTWSPPDAAVRLVNQLTGWTDRCVDGVSAPRHPYGHRCARSRHSTWRRSWGGCMGGEGDQSPVAGPGAGGSAGLHAYGVEQYLSHTDRRLVRRINDLIVDILRNGHEGIGKPELLRGELSGFWSRRIDQDHRLVNRIREAALTSLRVDTTTRGSRHLGGVAKRYQVQLSVLTGGQPACGRSTSLSFAATWPLSSTA